MGFFTGIGKILGLVGSSDTASELAKDLSSGVDKIFYTAEEKADHSADMYQKWLAMVAVMKSSEALRSVTRRILSVGIIFNLLAMIWLCVFSEILHAIGWIWFDTPIFDVVEKNGLQFTNLTWSVIQLADIFYLGWVFCTIIVFYFGPHMIQHFKGAQK